MKICVTASGPSLDHPVDERFGRAAWFIIFDTDTGEHHAVQNSQNLAASQGAGIQAATTVAEHSADCVLTGHCGPKAFRVLKEAGITVVTGARGLVCGAIEAYTSGELKPAAAADVAGHWL